jgi:sugar lactone lactonase YvrE
MIPLPFQARRAGLNLLWVALLVAAVAAGCATRPKTKANSYFFPPPPDEPRMQYLVGFSSEDQLFGQSGFRNFVLGPDRSYKPIGKPYGVTTGKGRVYVCDTLAATVGVFKLDKQELQYVRAPGPGAMRTPINAAVDAKGNIYVADTGREQVVMYAPDFSYLGALGRKDEMKPSGVAVQGENLYVADLKNHAVRVYRLSDQQLVRTLPKEGTDAAGRLYSPTNLAVDDKGRVYVSDTGAFCVQVYDAEGNHLRKLGGQGLAPGNFARPKGIAVDHEGRVYVADAATQVVQLFDDQGRLLMYFGDPSATGAGGTSLPAGITVDYANVGFFQKFAAPGQRLEYVVLLVNQYGDPKVSVYGFLKK